MPQDRPDPINAAAAPRLVAHPTIKDVARVAGVHFTTVALALRAHPKIPVETRRRIEAAAARVGYRRNEIFHALSRRRLAASTHRVVPALAYITNRSEQNGLFSTAHHRRMVAGARRQAEAMGYGFELLAVDAGAYTSVSLQRYLQKRGISGVIVGALQPGRADLSLNWSEFSVVKIDSRHIDVGATFISNDQFHAVRLAHRELRALGFRRIGLAVGASDEETTGDLHQGGFHLAQSDLPGTQRTQPLLFPHGFNETDEVVPLVREWIREQSLDAVLCNWTNVRTLIRRAGFRCPADIACACLCLAHPQPGLAGVVANFELVGQHAVALLATQMRAVQRGASAAPTETYVEGHWHHGDSARAHS